MDGDVVPIEKLDLQLNRELLSPPWLDQPLYQCASAVTVWGFVVHAMLEVEVNGAIVASVVAGFPEPQGERIVLSTPLVAGQQVRVRQQSGGLTSDWSAAVVVRDHTLDFPAGPPRPQVNPAPVYTCGARTGVGNLLGGANVWITADGAEVGRVDGCSAQQGVNVNPFYAGGQRVRAHTELCSDEAPPSIEHVSGPGPNPLAIPGFGPMYAGGEQITVTGITNGARVSLTRSGTPLGTFRCWGGSLLVGVSPGLSTAEVFTALQELCAGDPASGIGTGVVEPCSSLPAPGVGPVQAGDITVTVTSSAPGATIQVFRNGVHVGTGSAPVVFLTQMLVASDTVHVIQNLPGCSGRLALQLTVACIDPPVSGDPSAHDLFPVGHTEYAAGPVRGSVYYPAQADGEGQPFHERLASLGRTPIVVMAHGNHSPTDPSYLGYDYFQASLAKTGIIAVSVDCNALNGPGGGVGNIEDRADLIIDSIKHFQSLDASPGNLFSNRIDFDRLGLMGHSRGGDAMVTVPTVIGSLGVRIRAVLALAPTNFRYWAGMSTIRPDGYTFCTILPAADGDVVDNNGAQFYDQSIPGPLTSQVYVLSTNHNFFNRQWTVDDGVTAVLPRPTHERILDVYGSAVFRRTLLGHSTQGYLTERVRPSGVPPEVVDLSYRVKGSVTVDNHDDDNTIVVNSLGLPTTTSAGVIADEFPFDQVAGAFNPSFFGLTMGMVLTSKDKPGGDFRSEVKPTNLRGRQVWIRVAEVVGAGGVAQAGVSFDLGLEDAGGVIGWIASDSVGGVPRPFARPGQSKSMLNTLRFRPDCARPEKGRLDTREIVAVHLRPTSSERDRPLAFDDLQFVKA